MEEKRKKKRILWLLLLLLLLIGGIVTWHFYAKPKTVMANIENVDNDFIKQMDEDQLKAFLQKKADKDYVHLKVDTKMNFKSTGSIGQVNIQNPPANTFGLRVLTHIKGSDEVLYDSGILKPKEYVSEGKLKQKLAVGTYQTNSQVLFYDLKKATVIGESAFVGELTVQG